MIRILIPLTLAASLAAVSVPATAQSLTTQSAPASWKPLPQRQDDVAQQIALGVDSHRLSDAQAHALRDQFKGLLNLEDEYRKSGMTPAQQADLEARYDTMEARIQVESHPASVEIQRAPTTTVITEVPAN
jgi:hypothetical protein